MGARGRKKCKRAGWFMVKNSLACLCSVDGLKQNTALVSSVTLVLFFLIYDLVYFCLFISIIIKKIFKKKENIYFIIISKKNYFYF